MPLHHFRRWLMSSSNTLKNVSSTLTIFSSIVGIPKVRGRLSWEGTTATYQHGLVVNLVTSKFHVPEIIFLVYVIHSQEFKRVPATLETMCTWPIPAAKKKVQTSLAFANYSHWFIVTSSTKARPLTDFTKDISFTWGHTKYQPFNELQTRFLSATILT